MKYRVVCVVGTRPEAIKMAPVVNILKQQSWADVTVLATGQHRELLERTLAFFNIPVDVNLNVMTENQGLSPLTARIFEGLDPILDRLKPDYVLSQGDTTTVFVCSVVCFYRGLRYGHVEAGLRTGDFSNPFPEEFNRVVASIVAYDHFAPTEGARAALLRQGIKPDRIHVTGNTVIDALKMTAARDLPMPVAIDPGRDVVLMTAHRRENFGAPMESIFAAIRRLHDELPSVEIVFPVHPNPNVRNLARQTLGSAPRIHLLEPLDYPDLVAVLKRAKLVLTDSGGLQEEAPALGKPVLVLREATERPEAVEAGVARLIGTREERVFDEAKRLLTDASAYREMARGVSPYGDGEASGRIAKHVAIALGVSS
jgi:UDP-N-acetylglucosamine 2-epimerase (non-hydrolysing)